MEADRLGHGRYVIVLDANTLIYLAEGRAPLSTIDRLIDAPYHFVVPSGVREELEALARRGGLEGRRASAAIELMRRLGAREVETRSRGDEAVIEAAVALRGSFKIVVATSDRGLRERLRREGFPTIYYRSSKGDMEMDWSPL